MFNKLGAVVTALTLAFAGGASAQMYLVGSFETISSDPTISAVAAIGPQYRPGAFSIDTIGQVDVVFRFHREGEFLSSKYDFFDDLVALGDLPGVLSIHGRPSTYIDPQGSQTIGRMEIVYSGPDISANGLNFSAGDYLVASYLRLGGQFRPSFNSEFIRLGNRYVLPAGFGMIDLTFLDTAENGGGWTSDVSGSLVAPLPEPSTWAMMIIGFGLSGAVLRRGRQLADA